jgi:hypothetical protein
LHFFKRKSDDKFPKEECAAMTAPNSFTNKNAKNKKLAENKEKQNKHLYGTGSKEIFQVKKSNEKSSQEKYS